MHRRHQGQSIVEMAFILPILLIVVFAIIEFGYLIFAYSTISQAARNGAEIAAQLPPHESWLKLDPGTLPLRGYRADDCVNAVYAAIESDLTIFSPGPNTEFDMTEYVTISYPQGGNTRNLEVRGPIEVKIEYPVRGITPLFQLLGLGDGSGVVTMRVIQRRSLENLGRDPTRPQGVACASDLNNWKELNPSPTP